MRWLEVNTVAQARKVLEQIGVDAGGIPYMVGKAVTRVIKLEKVPAAAAHILKQEMLALGGDAAVNRNLIINAVDTTDVVLLGTYKQLKRLAVKLKAQPFGRVRKIAEALNTLLANLEKMPVTHLDCNGKQLELGSKTLLMGILNVTPDSFADGGKYFTVEAALKHAEKLIQDGADIIDIGAESTRPGHVEISAEEYGLTKDSVILLEQIRTIDKKRLKERVGHLSDELMKKVDECIQISFGLVDYTV